MDLRCTVADLHTTLLALYVADETVWAHTHQFVQARASREDLIPAWTAVLRSFAGTAA